MINLCIIGNSHTGALKRAWDQLVAADSKKKVRVTFFAQRAGGLEKLRLDAQSLVPNDASLKKALEFTSGGETSIDVTKYDAFLIYGVGLNAYYSDGSFFSREVTHCALIDNFGKSLGYKLLMMIRSVSNSKVYLGHVPLASNLARDKVKNSPSLSVQYVNGETLANDKLFASLNCVLVCQPQETLVGNNRNTHSRFSKESKRLDIGDNLDSELHPTNENIHMNDAYGEIWLTSFLERLFIDNIRT
jgi:hypothetical protein